MLKWLLYKPRLTGNPLRDGLITLPVGLGIWLGFVIFGHPSLKGAVGYGLFAAVVFYVAGALLSLIIVRERRSSFGEPPSQDDRR